MSPSPFEQTTVNKATMCLDCQTICLSEWAVWLKENNKTKPKSIEYPDQTQA